MRSRAGEPSNNRMYTCYLGCRFEASAEICCVGLVGARAREIVNRLSTISSSCKNSPICRIFVKPRFTGRKLPKLANSQAWRSSMEATLGVL